MTHNLVAIYSIRINEYEDRVVRWCKNCGAVVVDTDFDGRTQPGDMMQMIFPNGKNCN